MRRRLLRRRRRLLIRRRRRLIHHRRRRLLLGIILMQNRLLIHSSLWLLLINKILRLWRRIRFRRLLRLVSYMHRCRLLLCWRYDADTKTRIIIFFDIEKKNKSNEMKKHDNQNKKFLGSPKLKTNTNNAK